ncbi:motility protein A [Pengzhenrongella sicca]|uniref:MotA/TolQ/ExbB proton channel family protein n=1 Tax=Pengzhenrongella sicca TaxID=2819238 RepID=A0A8A4ZJV3_9MICO|nr:MotA/TolQ/ExbB proton channel family protein [Pengzhenrongella sicca]QTE29878.1 MotA/TolQ/ExbB proton channel family protein [Pengzhenrongella sicca]
MDPAAILGVVIAFGAVLASIIFEGSSPMSVLLPAPMLLVIGGTLGAGLTGSTLRDAKRAFASLPAVFTAKLPEPEVTVATLVSLADRARREGLLALEDAAKEIDDAFLKAGLQAAIDGTDPEDLRMILDDKIQTKRAQDRSVGKYFADMGGYAPTIGIIGTVVSLVHVLENLSSPDVLGPLIAAAFVATLWGLLTANLLWLPLASRIKRLSDLECTQMEVAVEGLLAVQAGANPRLVGERLRSLLPASDAKADKPAKKAAA